MKEKEKKRKFRINGVIAILLVLVTMGTCALCFRLASVPAISVDKEEPTLEEQISGLQKLKLPTKYTEIYSDVGMFEKLYKNTEITYELTEEGGVITAPAGHGESGSAYAYVKLTEEGGTIPVSDYNYITLEFDVSAISDTLPLNCCVYLINRNNLDGVSTALSSAATNLYVIADENNEFNILTDLGVYTARAKSSFHVKYVFKIDHSDVTKSQLQIWIDGNVRYDSSLSEKAVFSSDVTHIDELRIKKFSANGGEIMFSNLSVKGYE